MKTLIVNYSKTGNNKILADIISKKLQADMEDIIVRKEPAMFDIVLDMMFNRKPDIHKPKKHPVDYEHIIMIAPVWMGKLSSPLFSYIKEYNSAINAYSFITVSGGAKGKNVSIKASLNSLVGKKADNVTQLYINDLLADADKKQMKKTSLYKIKKSDIEIKFKTEFGAFVESLSNDKGNSSRQ